MKIKRILRLIALVIVGISLVACTKKESSPSQSHKGLKIVTSFYPIYSVVKEVSGDLNDVRMIQSSSVMWQLFMTLIFLFTTQER